MPGKPAFMTARLVDSLYVEAMLLADEARSYFDGFGRDTRDGLEPMQRVAFSCESLKVTTRLMHSVAWLLTQRAIAAGDLRPAIASSRLGRAMPSEVSTLAHLPDEARQIINASEDLYDRIARMDGKMHQPLLSPVRQMQDSLVQAF
jgi:regulator of CtrA degradation